MGRIIPIYEMENKKYSKPPTSLDMLKTRWMKQNDESDMVQNPSTAGWCSKM